MTQPALTGLRCVRCHAAADDREFGGCPTCRDEGCPANLETVYDLSKVAQTFDPAALQRRGPGLWRYRELLPVAEADAVTIGEGSTPLVPVPHLASSLGLRAVWIKDESRNPTWSFKDRGAALTASVARKRGAAGLVVSSTGNAAAATAAYARRASMRSLVLVARSIDPVMRSQLLAYAPCAVATPTKADRWVLMQHGVEHLGYFPNSNFRDPPVGNNAYAIDGYKTIALEIWEQLGRRAPDWLFSATGYGDGLYGMYKGFGELRELGLADMPRFAAAEVSGSLTATLSGDGDRVRRAHSTDGTLGFSISNPQSTYQAVAAVRGSGGTAVTVDNDELRQAQRLAACDGVFMEISAAAGVAALRRAVADGAVDAHQPVVVVNTSAGLKSIAALTDHEPDVPLASDAAALEQVLGQR